MSGHPLPDGWRRSRLRRFTRRAPRSFMSPKSGCCPETAASPAGAYRHVPSRRQSHDPCRVARAEAGRLLVVQCHDAGLRRLGRGADRRGDGAGHRGSGPRRVGARPCGHPQAWVSRLRARHRVAAARQSARRHGQRADLLRRAAGLARRSRRGGRKRDRDHVSGQRRVDPGQGRGARQQGGRDDERIAERPHDYGAARSREPPRP